MATIMYVTGKKCKKKHTVKRPSRRSQDAALQVVGAGALPQVDQPWGAEKGPHQPRDEEGTHSLTLAFIPSFKENFLSL